VVSSRRRHTRSKRDWSSDVCSSDLGLLKDEGYLTMTLPVSLDSILWGKALAAWILMVLTTLVCLVSAGILLLANVNLRDLAAVRSEERRVGEESGRSVAVAQLRREK